MSLSSQQPTKRKADPTDQPAPPPGLSTPSMMSGTQESLGTLGGNVTAAGLPNTSPSFQTPTTPASRKRKAPAASDATQQSGSVKNEAGDPETPTAPPPKRSRTNTPWTPAEEQRLKQMRDAGKSWSDIAKTFPTRTEGSVKKHWYKDMHYAEFAEDESAALLAAIKEYESSKWKVIGQKVGKPAKACEQYAKEHFAGKL